MRKIIILILYVFFNVQAFAQLDSILYGITRNTSTQQLYLSKVNPTTGQVTNISSVAFSTFISLGALASIDPYQNIFYLQSDNKLWGIDLSTGNVFINTSLSTPFPAKFDLMQYNCKDLTLYGITRNTSTQQLYLSKVNPTTGQVTNISSVAFSTFISLNALASIDPYQNIFYLQSDNKLWGIDLSSGNVVINTSLTTPFPALFDLMQYNCKDSTLYGITRNTSTQQLYLSKVNPTTGQVTNISSVAFSTFISLNALASIDPYQNIFYLQSDNKLWGIDLSSGNVVINTSLSTPFPAKFDLMRFYSDNCVTVDIDETCGEVYVPNAFSPNGDGNNDCLKVYSNCLSEVLFRVYSRWGALIYETEDINGCWDGFYNGTYLNSGVYAYTVQAKLINGEEIELKGDVTIFK